MTTYNIRNEDDCAALEAAGWTHFTVCPRGENKGMVLSKHKSRDAAEKAANGRDLRVCDKYDFGYF